ncbi:MAG: ZIP family metal transporter [Halobacteriaceae archaeon]
MVVPVVNNGPEPVTIAQVLVDEAYWDFRITGGGDTTLAPREHAEITIPYHTTRGWDFDITLITGDGVTVHHTVVAASPAPGLSTDLLATLALIGVFVGVVPVALGMLWFPTMQSLGTRWIHAILLFSAGILAFLAFDAGFEALEIAGNVPGYLDGRLLVVLGILGALLVVQAISAGQDSGEGEPSGLWLAYLVALGIGLHNLAGGLAIGSSFAVGRVALGSFLVIGFMLHNVTEGPAVVAPLTRADRPPAWHFLGLGALAGAPVIIGGWIGALAYSPTLGALFLAIGVGAILQVIWELTTLVDREGGTATSALNILAFGVGLLVMYATDIFVAL